MTAGFDTGTSHDDWVVVPRICDFMGENMADSSQHQQNELKIVSYKPAEFWTDAFPVGNGRLGAMIWGGVQSELLQLNEDTLWSGEPSNFTDPNVLTILPEVRKLVREGHYAQASITANKMAGQPTEVYKPLGDIKLDFGASHKDFDAESYERELDLDTAKATVKYVANGVEFVRETFASNPQQLIAIKLSANKAAALSFTVSLDSPLHYDSQASGQHRIIMQGYCPWTRNAPQLSTEETKKGTRFCAILEVQISSDAGAVSIIEGNKLKVDGSNWAVLLLSAASSFDGPFVRPENSQKDPVSAASATLSSVKGLSFSQLYTNHLLDYQNLFHRVTLKLSRNSNNPMDDRASTSVSKKAQILPCMEMTQMASGSKVSTADRVTAFAQDEDPALVTLLFQYGRYLLISSSRPGTQVSNLQGIWSQKVDPAWDAAPHLNINLEMNYWPAISCNLAECQEPLFELISNLAINGSKTSQVNYQTGGWVTHHVTDIWAKTSPSDGDAKWSIWPMGGAWLCTHLWEYYAYTRDTDFLKEKAYPLLKGCATFLYDWLLKEIDDILVTNPSTSPEHEFIAPNGEKASVSYATAMDMAIIREIFSAVISAAKILGNTDEEFIAKLKDAQPKLFPPRISRDGSLMEWAQDFEDPEPQHRHMSHLFGLYPGHTITKETTPELCIAAEKSLIKRGEDGPGWSTVWKTSLWARLGNSEHAYRMVKKLITLVDPTHEEQFEGGLYANLFTAHPPFQIDANFGFSAAIAEILVQSNETELFFLPALPKDKWPNGCVQGLKARGHVSVSICWKGGKMIKVGLVAENQHQQRNLHYNGMSMQVTLLTGFMHIFSTDLKKIKAVPLISSTTELRASKSSSCSIL